MVELFYVRLTTIHAQKLHSHVFLQYRFHGRSGVRILHSILGRDFDRTFIQFWRWLRAHESWRRQGWALDPSRVWYSVCICAESIVLHLIPFLTGSISAITAHIPYVRPILDALTGKNGPAHRARSFGRERVLKRLETGASRKDLFYHLVRRYIECDVLTSLRPVVER